MSQKPRLTPCFFFSSRRRHTRWTGDLEFRRVLFRSEQGYLLFEGFLEADELAAARDALWLYYPRPETYFADPAAHAWLATDQWAGEVSGPWRSWNLRSEERRVGKEWRSRWRREHE